VRVTQREALFERYQELQRYLGWQPADGVRLQAVAEPMRVHFPALVADFYERIASNRRLNRLLNGDQSQIERLKVSLHRWLEQLFAGVYDRVYVESRWHVGLRHAEIGLEQMDTNGALASLRDQLGQRLETLEQIPKEQRYETARALNRLLDLDLAVMAQAYEYRRLKLEKLAERRRGEIQFRNLVEAAACMIVILREDGSIVYFSPFAEKLTGYRAEELVGRESFSIFLPPHVRPALQERLQAVLGGEAVQNLEIPICCREGGERWLVWNALRLEDFDAQPALLAVGHDITDKRNSAERLVQAERLAAIGQTITGLAHESRNALQRINSCTEMLEFELEDNPEAMRLIRRSQQAQDDLRRLFDEVRSFAAPITLEPTVCPLKNVWREAWSLLQRERQNRDAELHEIMDEEALELYLDRFRMVQVFRNLLENALAACRDPVRIQVICRGLTDERQRPLTEIRLRDNGPGLGEQAQRLVFQPFFTTKSKGTGLGMAIAHRIVEAHGGTIAVGAEWDGGAEFVLRLPRERP
jgi:PAS domain S-box-containing protein